MSSKYCLRKSYSGVLTAIFAAILFLLTGCLVDSNSGTSSDFQIDTPFVFDMSGRWTFDLDQDTTFSYETRFSRSIDIADRDDSRQVVEQTSFRVTASRNSDERLAITLSANIFGKLEEGETYPVENEISNEERIRLINENQAIVQSHSTYSKITNLREENEERLHLIFEANNGSMEVTRLDNERFKAKITFFAILADGQKTEYSRSDSVQSTVFEPDTNAVEIESFIDIPIGRTDD